MSNVQDFIIVDIPSGNCAVCRQEDGYVIDTIVADPSDSNIPVGYYLIGIELNTPVTIGCRWDGTKFLDSQGNPVISIVPETKCAVVDSNSYVIDLAMAQINAPFLYENNILIPIPPEAIVQKGFYWTGSEFILVPNGIKATVTVTKSEKTKDFLNKIVIEKISDLKMRTRPCGIVTKINYGEYSDTLTITNILGDFFVGSYVSNTELYMDCPQVMQVLKE